MTDQATVPGKTPLPVAGAGGAQAVMLAILAALLLGAGFVARSGLPSVTAYAAGGAVSLVAIVLVLFRRLAGSRARRDLASARALIEHDPTPCLCTDGHGVVIAQNAAARARFGPRDGQPVSRALSGRLVNAPAVVFRQESALAHAPAASETVPTAGGQVRLTATRIGPGTLWRVDEQEGDPRPREAEGTGLPHMVASPSGTILSMNEAMRRLLGRRARRLAEIFSEGSVEEGPEVLLAGATGPVSARLLELPAADGRREIYALPAELLPRAIDVQEAEGVGADLDALPVALAHVTATGRILSANRQALELLGLPDADPQAPMSLAELVEGPGRPSADWLRDVSEARIPSKSEVVRLLRAPGERFIQISFSRVGGAGTAGLWVVLQDATAFQSLQQQFVQSQKMQAIGELAGGVAHDFNNLLTAISGHCDLLLPRHDQGDQDFADLMQINQNANRAASLVGQLLGFSRKQTMRTELMDLRDSMGDLIHLLNRLVGEKVTLQLSHDPALQPIRADRRLLDQAIMNLVVNARDAMPEGGAIRIETGMQRLAEPLLRDNARVPAGSYVTIRVIDEGVGIPAESLSRIFEPFFTTKRVGEGTGLGLSMVYGIVKQSGGYIFVDSEIGKGTAFTIYCPAHDWPDAVAGPDLAPEHRHDPAPSSPERGVRPPAHGPSDAECAVRDRSGDTASGDHANRTGATRAGRDGVVLLVEDEAPVRAFASRALRLNGFRVLEATDGEDALEKLSDPGLKVDCFVTDVIMPGLDGPSWVKRALADRPGVKVVFVSGYAEDGFRDADAEIPNSVFLPKPFSLSALTDTVSRQLA